MAIRWETARSISPIPIDNLPSAFCSCAESWLWSFHCFSRAVRLLLWLHGFAPILENGIGFVLPIFCLRFVAVAVRVEFRRPVARGCGVKTIGWPVLAGSARVFSFVRFIGIAPPASTLACGFKCSWVFGVDVIDLVGVEIL